MIILKLILLFFIVQTPLYASNNYIGIENFSPYIDQVQVDEKGELNFFETNFGAYLGHKRIIFSSYVLEINGVIYLPKSDVDEVMTTISTRWSAMVHITQWWIFRPMIGSTLHADFLSGKGGTSVQNNGSSTSTFFAPSESVVNVYATPVVGFEIKLSDRIRAQALIEVTNVTKEEKRFISNYINIQWKL